MIEVLQMKGKIKPVHEVVQSIQATHPQIFVMQDIIHYLQLAIYWFEGAAQLLYESQQKDDITHSEDEPGVPWPPTPEEVNSDVTTKLTYAFNKLYELELQVFTFLEDLGMEEKPRFYLKGALNKIIEAKSTLVLAGIYHERLQTIGATNQKLLGPL